MSWLTKIAKYVNEHSLICEHCLTFLVPKEITINRSHIYTIGQMFYCSCYKSRVWTNSIRNEDNLLKFFKNIPVYGRVEYYNGFCNDLFCGHTFEPLKVIKNGVSVPGMRREMDRIGIRQMNKETKNIAIDFYAEDREGQTQNILEWYRQRLPQLESIVRQVA